jgi:hypothetical protein
VSNTNVCVSFPLNLADSLFTESEALYRSHSSIQIDCFDPKKSYFPFYQRQPGSLLGLLFMCLPRVEIMTAVSIQITRTLFDYDLMHEMASLASIRSRFRLFPSSLRFDCFWSGLECKPRILSVGGLTSDCPFCKFEFARDGNDFLFHRTTFLPILPWPTLFLQRIVISKRLVVFVVAGGCVVIRAIGLENGGLK